MKKAIDLLMITTTKSFIRWFGGLQWSIKLAIIAAVLLCFISIGIPAMIGAFVLWVGYKLTLGKLVK
jgi:hypothetical protein